MIANSKKEIDTPYGVSIIDCYFKLLIKAPPINSVNKPNTAAILFLELEVEYKRKYKCNYIKSINTRHRASF